MLVPKFRVDAIRQVAIASLVLCALSACSDSTVSAEMDGAGPLDNTDADSLVGQQLPPEGIGLEPSTSVDQTIPPESNVPVPVPVPVPVSSPQTVQNTSPVITAPDSLALSTSGTPMVVEIQVSDADNNSVSVSWVLALSPINGDMEIEQFNQMLQATISASVIGDYEVIVVATDGIDTTFKKINISVTNMAPHISSIVINPLALNAQTEAGLKIDAITDAEDDVLTLSYFWRVNDGASIETPKPFLSSSHYKRGDSITGEVVVSDGFNETRATSPVVIVENAPPGASSISIGPADARAGDAITAVISDNVDPDEDQLDTSYQWFVNAELLVGQTSDVLPVGIAKSADIVTVLATVTDGIDTVVLTSDELHIRDTPSHLEIDPIPDFIEYGLPFNLAVKFVDDDGTAVQTVLSQAPKGFVYDESTATASWTPTPVMSTKRESFDVLFSSSDGQSGSIKLTVQNDQNALLLARSGIPIPGSDFELDIGDFDGDGKTEVLSTNSLEHIFTLEFDGEAITQDWLYPFAVAPDELILRLWAYGTDHSQILVVTTRGIHLIESRSELPTRVVKTSYDISAALFDDIDSDGTKEVLVISPQGVLSKLNVEDWSLSTFSDVLSISGQSSDSFSVAVGNVDNDPALEIVVGTGHVIDGLTGELQWTHISPFGTYIAIGDVDGDGDTDIVASNRWDKVTSYDPIAQASIWSYDITDVCSLRLYDVDDDPQDELVVGPCQHGSLEIYDGSSGTMVLQDDIDDPAYNSALRSLSFGDLDSDGVSELIFSTGSGSTAEDNMAVASLASLGDSTPGVVVNIDPSQINGFKSIGWDINIEHERAVFVLPDTEGGGDGARVGLLSTDGNFIVSDVIAPNWDNVGEGVVVDSNGDGINEVVVGVGNVRDGEVHHLALDDFSRIHLHTEFSATEQYNRPEIVSISLGIDTDMSAKAIIATDQEKLQVYDIASSQIDWTSGGLTGGYMKDVIGINKAVGFDIAALTGSELTLWRKSGSIYDKINTAAVDCNSIQHLVINGTDKIACLLSDSWYDQATVTLFNSELIKESELTFDYGVTAISSTPEGELMIGTRNKIGSSYYNSDKNTLKIISPSDGSTIWESAPLLGLINAVSFFNSPTGGESKMAVSTSGAMYILDR